MRIHPMLNFSNHSNNLDKYKNLIEDKFENLCLSINTSFI